MFGTQSLLPFFFCFEYDIHSLALVQVSLLGIKLTKIHKSFKNYPYLIDSFLTYFKISSMFSCRRLQSWIKAYLRRNPFGIWSCLTLGHKLRGRGYSCGNDSKNFLLKFFQQNGESGLVG